MMFSSSCNNNNGDSDCFGAYDGSISSSSFDQVGSSFITPANNLLEDDQYFFLDQLLSMSQGQQQQFSLGYDTVDPVHLALTDYNNNDFLDGMMLVAGKDQIFSCDIEEVVAPSQTKAVIIDSSSNGGEICRDKPAVKRSPAKRIRSGKKDRHSKICTAQGPRDRRMRLSLQVARKFFDLQDKLRFDRASKTIEWLFHMSKNAIKEVMASRIMDLKNNNLESSLCENEEEDYFSSKCDHITTNYEDTNSDNFKIRINKQQRRSTSKKSKRNEEACCPQLKKDVRDKARAWARDRTVEKMRLRALKYPSQGLITTMEKATAAANPSNNHSYYSEQIGSCSAFDEYLARFRRPKSIHGRIDPFRSED